MKKIPTYLLHGPLGSGKTTILKEILAHPHFTKSIVIENEYADYNIDKQFLAEDSHEVKIIDVSGGCICCTSGSDLFEAFQAITKEQNIEQVFIETTGVASSVQLIKQMMLSREFDDHFLLVKNLLVIDALEESVELLKQEKMLDLVMADLIILHKTDLVDEKKLADFRSFLQSLPQLVFIETNHGKLDPNELISDEKSKALTTLLDHLDEISDTSIDHSQDILYQVVYPKKTVEIEELTSLIEQARANGASIRRAKGTFTLPSGDQISLNGTTNDLNMQDVKTKTQQENVLVFIGKNITKETIKPILDRLC